MGKFEMLVWLLRRGSWEPYLHRNSHESMSLLHELTTQHVHPWMHFAVFQSFVVCYTTVCLHYLRALQGASDAVHAGHTQTSNLL